MCYKATSNKATASPAAAITVFLAGLVCPAVKRKPRACLVEFQAWLVPVGSRKHVCAVGKSGCLRLDCVQRSHHGTVCEWCLQGGRLYAVCKAAICV
jgi:hypothetical protein